MDKMPMQTIYFLLSHKQKLKRRRLQPNRIFLADGTEIPGVAKAEATVQAGDALEVHADGQAEYSRPVVTRLTLTLVGPFDLQVVDRRPKKP